MFGEKVYYVERGCRHWIRDGVWLDSNGFLWPDDVTDVEPAILYSFLNSGHAPLRSDVDASRVDLTSVDIREIAASQLRGTGIEFGAGSSPFPVPLNCNVLFADAFAYEQLFAEMYPGQSSHDLVRPDYKTDIQTLVGVADASLDFVIACHVIEHTTNPIAAINSCYRALKAGGKLVLVVPDMTKTFDSKRQLTTLSHLIEDFQLPSRERDRTHYEEFYTKAFSIPSGRNPNDFVSEKHAEDFSIHFHTWTYESFNELILWLGPQTPWSAVWQHPTLHGAENIEFYFVLTK
ncbi:MAG: methyltransferase domain-containing protein [Comamonadaceae bacterium]|nr:methyltransferase domain-containing protein [Comamonadaceae bacterium]